ncbi:purine-cytosine permease family protein [Streptomyces sp. NBC_00316]|uniref:purine-cytosine permease family protein n=1 Tax=Streptomyces sp. NBC_00316 TaxID=2975710 RepID=UPI003FA6BA87
MALLAVNVRSEGTIPLVETRGLEPVPDSERTGRVRTLFPTWAAANMTVLLLTVGAGLIVLSRLNFWQVLVVAATAPVVSYGLVGLISVAGQHGGAPGMALSRAVFGQRGNLLPGALIWIARWGWETVNAVTGAYALLAVLHLLFSVRSTSMLIMAALLTFVASSYLVSGLGMGALRTCCTWSAYLFGAFSVLVLIHLWAGTDWRAVLDRPAGPTALMVAGVGTLAAGGISWAPSGPDFTRYLPRTASGRSVVGATVGGAVLVSLPLVLMGAVMAVATPDLATSGDPVSFIGTLLPDWISVPYLLIAVVGMVLINAMSMYSAGFTAQTLGFMIPRAWAVGVNAAISLLLGGMLMMTASGFIDAFVSFLTLLAVTFSAWIGVFGADLLRGRTYDAVALLDTTPTGAYWYTGGYSVPAVTAWTAGLTVGLLLTGVEWFSGPLATTWIGRHGLGWAVTIAVSGTLYALLPRPAVRTGTPLHF